MILTPVDSIRAYQDELTAIRRDIHAHPELGFQENRTSRLVADYLQKWGIEVHRGIAKTGVVGLVTGQQSGAGIGLRADMDCLPMTETNSFPHRSTHAGRMHACGHDGHTAMLLGAARYLAETRRFAGTAVLIFQPAEEGGGGAEAMIKEGLFERFPVDAVYALHNNPSLPPGVIAVQPGPVEAAADEFELVVNGRGGHAAIPHTAIDPVLAAGHIITALQSIVSRNMHPLDAGVVTVASMQSSQTTASNVIPASVRMIGTARSFTAAARDLLEQRIGDIAANIAAAFGASVEYVYRRGYPATVNHREQALFAATVADSLIGADKVIRDNPLTMGAEDFSYMLQASPGAYIYLGQGGAEASDISACDLHNDRYDFNDNVTALGAGMLASLVEQSLPLNRS
ncbi:hippurate hydrolase [Collimonas sp. PA-H2]|nr:M20 aminoacylase family protein [Collimonas sp. PA-H2]PFH08044.1 hippurate hydrolase [Collimonas sp. PA-H2]